MTVLSVRVICFSSLSDSNELHFPGCDTRPLTGNITYVVASDLDSSLVFLLLKLILPVDLTLLRRYASHCVISHPLISSGRVIHEGHTKASPVTDHNGDLGNGKDSECYASGLSRNYSSRDMEHG